jgi:DNA repair ATPase RecN
LTESIEAAYEESIKRAEKAEQDKKLYKAGGEPVESPDPKPPTEFKALESIHKRLSEQDTYLQTLQDALTRVEERLTLILGILAPRVELDADEKELMDLMKAAISKDQSET